MYIANYLSRVDNMNSIVKKIGLVAGLLLAGTTSSHALVISATGAMDYIPAPASVMPGVLESNTLIRYFDEFPQGKTLPFNLTVDLTAPGSYTGTSLTAPATLGSIAAGTLFDSYSFHFDNLSNTAGTSFRAVGTVTFDQDILGVMVTNTRLVSSDFLGLLTTYPAWSGVGMETSDIVGISADRRTLSLSLLTAGTGTDRLRVITAGTPVNVDEPMPLLLLGLSGVMLSLFVRRKRVAA